MRRTARSAHLNIKRSQNERLYVMVLWSHNGRWTCFARCATPRAAGVRYKLAWSYHHADAVDMVWAVNAEQARKRAALRHEQKRKAREHPKCGNCNAPIAKGEDFCSTECQKGWEAVAGALRKMNAHVGQALLSR